MTEFKFGRQRRSAAAALPTKFELILHIYSKNVTPNPYKIILSGIISAWGHPGVVSSPRFIVTWVVGKSTMKSGKHNSWLVKIVCTGIVMGPSESEILGILVKQNGFSKRVYVLLNISWQAVLRFIIGNIHCSNITKNCIFWVVLVNEYFNTTRLKMTSICGDEPYWYDWTVAHLKGT